MKECYQFEKGRLLLIDPELEIEIDEVCLSVKQQEFQNPKGICHYLDKKLHGPAFFYSFEGKLLSEAWFYQGEKIGKTKRYSHKGQLIALERYQNGVLHGKQEYFYPNGQIKTVLFYKNGKLHGKAILWGEQGEKKRVCQFKQGEKIDDASEDK